MSPEEARAAYEKMAAEDRAAVSMLVKQGKKGRDAVANVMKQRQAHDGAQPTTGQKAVGFATGMADALSAPTDARSAALLAVSNPIAAMGTGYMALGRELSGTNSARDKLASKSGGLYDLGQAAGVAASAPAALAGGSYAGAGVRGNGVRATGSAALGGLKSAAQGLLKRARPGAKAVVDAVDAVPLAELALSPVPGASSAIAAARALLKQGGKPASKAPAAPSGPTLEGFDDAVGGFAANADAAALPAPFKPAQVGGRPLKFNAAVEDASGLPPLPLKGKASAPAQLPPIGPAPAPPTMPPLPARSPATLAPEVAAEQAQWSKNLNLVEDVAEGGMSTKQAKAIAQSQAAKANAPKSGAEMKAAVRDLLSREKELAAKPTQVAKRLGISVADAKREINNVAWGR